MMVAEESTQRAEEAPHADNGDLLQLYSTAKSEEFHFLNAHHSRVAFYAGLLTTLLAATLGGLANATETLHYGLILFGPAVSILVIITAFSGTWRPYRRFLEAVTVIAKLEERLGLTKGPLHPKGSKWYQTEPLVPDRFAKSRDQAVCSEKFVSMHRRRGFRRAVLWLLWLYMVCNIAVAALVVLRLAGV